MKRRISISQQRLLAFLVILGAVSSLLLNWNTASAGSNVSQRYVILAAGINSSTGSIDSDLGDIRTNLQNSLGVSRFVNFSYHAAVAMQRGELYCSGWSNGCSRGDGNLPSLYLTAVYNASDTQISIDPQADAMNYLVGQIVRQDPNAKIDIIGFSLGGIVAARYGAKYGSNSHIHAIITLESPLGGIYGAQGVVEGNPIMKVIFADGLHFNTDVLRSLQVPVNGAKGTIIDTLPQAARNYPFTAIGSSTDYVINSTAMPLDFGLLPWWQQVLLSFPGKQRISIGLGAQYWNVPSITRHYDQNLGGSLLTSSISPTSIMDHLNHGIATHSAQAEQWVRDAVNANSYVPDPPSSSNTITVNDESGDFHRFGPSQYWYHDSNGDNGGSTKTNSASYWVSSSYDNYAEWVPTIPSQGNYEIKVHIPSYPTADNVTYEVYSCGNNRTNVNVNQYTHRGQWVSLGVYCLPQGHAASQVHVGGKLILTDVNVGAPNLSKMVAWDTAQFIRQ